MQNSIKFNVVKKVGELGKLGSISNFESNEVITETPSTFLFLKSGCVPYLTPDNVSKIRNLPSIIQCPLNYLADKFDVLEKFNGSLTEFMGYKNYPVYISQSDPSQRDYDGGVTKGSISAWCNGGKEKVTLVDYFKIIRHTKPILWQFPCDNECSVEEPTEKRLQKAVERTISFYKITQNANQKERFPGLSLTSFTGGMNWLRRRQCLERMFDDSTKGIVIDGFLELNDDFSDSHIAKCANLIEQISQRIQNEEIRNCFVILPKIMQPSQIVKFVKLGIDMFDGAFPYLLTEANVAWIYPGYNSTSTNQYIVLSDNQYHDCFDTTIDPSCDCFSCTSQSHTRGYINHLINTKELLAKILLMIHNSTQYYRFFTDLRQSMKDDQFHQFHDWAITLECPPQYLINSKDVL